MKTYRFAVSNINNGFPGFWFYKQFPSAYYADLYAMRISFKKKNSMYIVSFYQEIEQFAPDLTART